MKPEKQSKNILNRTQLLAKTLEFGVKQDLSDTKRSTIDKLFGITIGLLGDFAASSVNTSPDSERLSELRENLNFSSRFFDSFIEANLEESLNPYFLLLGSASYYLTDQPGNARTLINKINEECGDLGGEGLEGLLFSLLSEALSTSAGDKNGKFGGTIETLAERIECFFKSGEGKEDAKEAALLLKEEAYKIGSPRQLLLADVIVAVLKKKIAISTWTTLPKYSKLPSAKWAAAMEKSSFLKELWPSQRYLGERGVFSGRSTTIQMPTSSGKTRAIEIIIRSAFLDDRASLAVIVAPFRALCHEIEKDLSTAFSGETVEVTELSDVLQPDFSAEYPEYWFSRRRQILVVTPEKLYYALRYSPGLTAKIGLLVFDESHQIDSGTRGIIYELLLITLLNKVEKVVQTVLISAVISNAPKIDEWLNFDPYDPNDSNKLDIIPSFRSIGFVNWSDKLGEVEFYDEQSLGNRRFVVPCALKREKLERQGKERKDRKFPIDKPNGNTNYSDFVQSIALYLGFKLSPNGGVAIFCSRKDSVGKISRTAIDILERNPALSHKSGPASENEIARIGNLIEENLGENAYSRRLAFYGLFTHHGDVPEGIRLSVEHAMRNNLVHFVICTSTLAQGVNLPIRYLIIADFKRGKEPIPTREFQNLIGRAGRAGMHTEGSIIFADPRITASRKSWASREWREAEKLLNPEESEPCTSSILDFFAPLKESRWPREVETVFPPGSFINAYAKDSEQAVKDLNSYYIENGHSEQFTKREVTARVNILHAIESFLLAEVEPSEINAVSLAKKTFAYHVANEEQKHALCELFKCLARKIDNDFLSADQRMSYSRTLFGIRDAEIVEKWVLENRESLVAIDENTDVVELLWPLFLSAQKEFKLTKNYDENEAIDKIRKWTQGKPYRDLCGTAGEGNDLASKMGLSKKEVPKFNSELNHILKLFANLSYQFPLVINAVCELMTLNSLDENSQPIKILRFFQKRVKYGLPTQESINLYELGFSDRVIAQKIAIILEDSPQNSNPQIEAKAVRAAIGEILERYPQYFQDKFSKIESQFVWDN